MVHMQSKHIEKESNRMVENIIKELVLIDVYCNCHLKLEKSLVLAHITSHHAKPDITETYALLDCYMATTRPYTRQPGHSSKYDIPDVFEKAIVMLLSTLKGLNGTESEDTEDIEASPELEDVSVELDE